MFKNPGMPIQSSVETRDWVSVDVKAFAFSLPPSMKEKRVKGTDSIVWKYADDTMELVVDLGPYGGKPSVYRSKPEYRGDWVEVNGKKAEMIFFVSDEPSHRERPYVAAIYFSEIGAKDMKLSLTVRANSRHGQEIGNAIFRSIKFSEPAKVSNR